MKKLRFSNEIIDEFTEEELNALLVTKHNSKTLKILVIDGGNREIEGIFSENGQLYAVLKDFEITNEREIIFIHSSSINYSCFTTRNI